MRQGLVLVLLAVLVACNGDDDAAPETTGFTSTSALTTTATAETTPGTTEAPTTTAGATTQPAPPTTSVEDLKAVIAAALAAVRLASYAFLVDPNLEALPAHLESVAVPGSPIEASLTAYLTELVTLGDGVIPGDPDIVKVTVERIELVGPAPYTMALATVCSVDNRPRATLPQHTPDGTPIYVEGSGDLQALRQIHDVRLAPAGWRLYDTLDEGGFLFPGLDRCPTV